MRDKLDARDDQEGWESDPIEDSQNSEKSKSSASANLDVFSVVSDAVDKD